VNAIQWATVIILVATLLVVAETIRIQRKTRKIWDDIERMREERRRGEAA
jgi:cell division protein ZapA (FtsZ GTPase activity inhibitor)